MKEGFRVKWDRAFRPRWLQTTCALLRLSGSGTGRFVARLAEPSYFKLLRRMPGAKGWAAKSGAKAG